MSGLGGDVIQQANIEQTIGRINFDVRSDMILAPHYSAIFANASDELWQLTRHELMAGTYYPSIPIRMEVPKPSGLTRPGTILTPKDRVVYQLLIDLIAPDAEANMERGRVFSNVLLNPDPQFNMFEASGLSWEKFQNQLQTHCANEGFQSVVRADVANYFERIKHHSLIGLLRASNITPGAVNLLETILMAWTEHTSFGIPQGVFPSDFLGNYYLSVIDSILSVEGVTSVRYVDDFFVFFPTEAEATRGLVSLISVLRKEGLSLNESKSEILSTDDVLREETEIDQMFAAAWEDIEGNEGIYGGYGFQNLWLTDDDIRELAEFNSEALINLYGRIDDVPARTADKIDKFCLPFFSANGSDIAVERSITGISQRPHLASLYCSYLGRATADNPDVSERLQEIFRGDTLHYETQFMYLGALLSQQEAISDETVNRAIALLQDRSLSVGLRGLMPLLIGRRGSAAQRRNMRHMYQDEPSDYVQAAILFSTRFFPRDERQACVNAWGNHNYTNTLVAQAMRNL